MWCFVYEINRCCHLVVCIEDMIILSPVNASHVYQHHRQFSVVFFYTIEMFTFPYSLELYACNYVSAPHMTVMPSQINGSGNGRLIVQGT